MLVSRSSMTIYFTKVIYNWKQPHACYTYLYFYVKDNTISSIPNFNGSQYVYLYNPL